MYYHPFAGIRCKTQTSTTKKGIIMNKETNGHLYILNDNIVRIADALEEILRLVKEDQKSNEKYKKAYEEHVDH